ncbi:MAG: DinB family protein [Fibrobacterales bacterium]
MMNVIEILKSTRDALITSCEALTDEQLLLIPEGWSNNILWHLGHCLVTQQILIYKRAQSTMYVSDDLINQFVKGSSPQEWKGDVDIRHIFKELQRIPSLLNEDYSELQKNEYQSFVTGTGTPINSLDDAISFNLYHEGMHMGLIFRLKKAVV